MRLRVERSIRTHELRIRSSVYNLEISDPGELEISESGISDIEASE